MSLRYKASIAINLTPNFFKIVMNSTQAGELGESAVPSMNAITYVIARAL